MAGVNSLFVSQRNLAPVQQQQRKMPALASQRSPRFWYWLLFFVLSLVVVGASIEATDRVQGTSRGIKNQKWAVSCSIISWCVALAVVVMHISPVFSIFFVNTKLEGGICIIMMCLWSALVAVISDSTNGLAVDGEGSVAFGNLYYCGWGGFICAILLSLNYLKRVYLLEVNEELRLRSDRLNLWIGCFVVNVILTASAANVFDNECLGSDRYGTKFCNRSLLALVDGGAGCGLSIVIIGMKFSTGLAPWGIELLLSVFLFLCNCFSMGLVTAEDGPGAKIGNLFYFSWLSLIVPFMIMSATFEFIRELHEEKKKDEVVDAYEQHPMMRQDLPPQSDSNGDKNFALSPNYIDSAQSVAPTEYSGAQSQYDGASVGHDSKVGRSIHDGDDSRRQSFFSQGASTYAGDDQSRYDGGQSNFDGNQSNYGGGGDKSVYDGNQSNYDGGQSVYDGNQSNYDGGQSVYDGNQSTYDDGQSRVGGAQSYATGMDGGQSYASGMDDDLKKPDKLGYYGGDMDSSFKKRNSGYDMDGAAYNSQGSGMDASYLEPAPRVKQQPWSGASLADSYNLSYSSGVDIRKPTSGDSSFV